MQKLELNFNTEGVVNEILEKLLPLIEAKSSTVDPIYRREDVAELLQISLPTLHKLTKEGIIKSRAIGKNIYYLHSDILASMKERSFVFNNSKNRA